MFEPDFAAHRALRQLKQHLNRVHEIPMALPVVLPISYSGVAAAAHWARHRIQLWHQINACSIAFVT